MVEVSTHLLCFLVFASSFVSSSGGRLNEGATAETTNGSRSRAQGHISSSKTGEGAASLVLDVYPASVAAGGIDGQGSSASRIGNNYISAASSHGTSASTSLNGVSFEDNSVRNPSSGKDLSSKSKHISTAAQISAALHSGSVSVGGIIGGATADDKAMVMGSVGSSAPGVSTSLSAGELRPGKAKAAVVFNAPK